MIILRNMRCDVVENGSKTWIFVVKIGDFGVKIRSKTGVNLTCHVRKPHMRC